MQAKVLWSKQRARNHSEGDLFDRARPMIALITGGTRGIGAAITKRLAADGANVARHSERL